MTVEQEVSAPTRRKWLVPAIVGAVVVIAVVVILLSVTSRPSLQSVSEDCGGAKAGIMLNDNALAVNPLEATPQTLVCVTDKLLPSTDDQYKVTSAADAGADVTLHLGGYTIIVAPIPGHEAAVAFQG